MQVRMNKRVPRGWENGKPVDVTVEQAVEITRKSDQLKLERLKAAKPCGCYEGRWGRNPEFEKLTGEEKNICLFHALWIGDEIVGGFNGTLSEIFDMNEKLGRPCDYGLRSPSTPEVY